MSIHEPVTVTPTSLAPGSSCAICSPGPSLATAQIRQVDVSIAVNRAILHVQADYWAFLDWPLFQDVMHETTEDLSRSTLLTEHSAYKNIRLSPSASRCQRFKICTYLAQVRGRKKEWRASKATRYTALCAIIFAWQYLKADTIYCYGMDMLGEQDYDGHTNPRNTRDKTRWLKEKRAFDELTDLIHRDHKALIRQ